MQHSLKSGGTKDHFRQVKVPSTTLIERHVIDGYKKFYEHHRGWVGYGVLCHFQQYFSYIVVVSFIGGGNLGMRRNPLTCCKSLTNFIT